MDNGDDPPMKKFKPLAETAIPSKRPLILTASSSSSAGTVTAPRPSQQRSAPAASSLPERRTATESMWMPQSEKLAWLQTRYVEGADPRSILQSLSSSSASNSSSRTSRFQGLYDMIPPHLPPELLWRFLFEMSSEPNPRPKLPNVNTLDDVVTRIRGARNIIVVAGAGLSVSCGIPDFRSKDGLYARVAAEFPQLRDPQSIFDAEYFRQDPRPFFRFAKNIFVPMTGGELHYKPSPAHRFITELEKQGKLLRIYTQNIDGLEVAAGLSHNRVVACHGSFETSTCTSCGRKIDSTEIADHINNGTVAYCNSAPSTGAGSNKSSVCDGVLKPDIVFFGESLPSAFHGQMAVDKSQADLLIVIGSSMRVRPVSLIPFALAPSVPQILINRERLRHMTFDVELLGDCDVIVAHLRKKLGWLEPPPSSANSGEKPGELPSFAFYPPNTYIFASVNGASAPPLSLMPGGDDDDDDDSDDWSDSSSSSSSSAQSPLSSPASSSNSQPKRIFIRLRDVTPKKEDEPNNKDANEQGPSDSSTKKE